DGVIRDADGVARYLDRPSSLVELLRASVERDPGARALVELAGPSLSAGGLRAAGVQREDRVAIQLANGIDWVLAFFGTQLLGAAAVPVNTRLTADETSFVLKDSEASFACAP